MFKHAKYVALMSCSMIAFQGRDSPSSVIAVLNTTNKQNVEIHFELNSQDSIKIYTSALPWFIPPEITFTLVPSGGGIGLRRMYFAQSPIPGYTDLKPGIAYKGNMNLLDYFPDLRLENSKHDLIFFWYWLPSKEIKSFENKNGGYGGWVLIPRNYLEKR